MFLKAGEWVQITAGPYKGDPAIVNWAEPDSDGTFLRLLVIPRLLDNTGLKTVKRKRASAPPPQLFKPDTFESQTGGKVCKDENGHHAVGIFTFESGLLCHDVAPYAVQVDPVLLPLNMFIMFRQSGHCLASWRSHPKPNEWAINKGDRVRVTSEPVMWGTVVALSSRLLEVQGDAGVGSLCVFWGDVLKEFQESDFVEVVTGPCAGRRGWILSFADSQATLLDERTVSEDTTQVFNIHVLFAYLTFFVGVTSSCELLDMLCSRCRTHKQF